MKDNTETRTIPMGWKLTFLLPLSAAVVLQVMSQRQTNLHEEAKLSIIGNLFLSVSMIAYSLYLNKKLAAWWTIAMVIFTSALLGFGLHVLLRAL